MANQSGKMKIAAVILTALAALAVQVPAFAVTNGEVLAALRRGMEQAGICKMDFTLSSDSYDVSGCAYVSEKCYRIESGEFLIVADGTSKWIYNGETDEAVVMKDDRSNPDLIENPFFLFSGMDGVYDFNPSSEAAVRSGAYVLSVKPLDKDYPYRNISVRISSSYRLLSADFSSQSGDRYSLKVTSYTPGVKATEGMFTFTPGKETYVTDLR